MKENKNEIKLHKAYDFTIGNVVNFTTIFIHGIAGHAQNFAELFEYLKDFPDLNTRIVAFDLLGAGESPSGDELDFGYAGQLAALRATLATIEGPVVIVGHSMGTLIATRLADLEPDLVQKLILVSPPIYTKENLASAEFKTAMTGFQAKIKAESASTLKSVKAFDVEVADIVMDTENYDYLVKVPCKTTLIYGKKDAIIASFNIPSVLQANHLITAVETAGGHSVTSDKYAAILAAMRGEQ